MCRRVYEVIAFIRMHMNERTKTIQMLYEWKRTIDNGWGGQTIGGRATGKRAIPYIFRQFFIFLRIKYLLVEDLMKVNRVFWEKKGKYKKKNRTHTWHFGGSNIHAVNYFSRTSVRKCFFKCWWALLHTNIYRPISMFVFRL